MCGRVCKCKQKLTTKKRRRQRSHHGGSILSNLKNKFNARLYRNAMKPKSTSDKKGFDLHGATLGAVSKIFGKRGMVPKPFKFLGPGNPLMQQVMLKNGKISKYLVKPYNVLDRIASKHDVCYHNGKKTKNRCDLEMIKEMKAKKSQIPKGMGTLVNAIIGGKLALGV